MPVLAVVALMIASCNRESRQPSVPARQFTTEVMLKTTPVKNQGRSNLCWVYAMLATIESEHLMMGDSVNLSADFVARHMLSEMADQYYLSSSSNALSLRGMATMMLNRLERYGMLAYDTYHTVEPANYNVLVRKLTKAVDAARAQQAGLEQCRQTVERLLDDAIRPVPRFQFMFGAEYTTLEFAHSVCRKDEYVALTSFTHHPFGGSFALEVPDNRDGDLFLNIPVDSLLHVVERAVRSGHAVCWEGDTSEPGCSFTLGLAEVKRGDKREERGERIHKSQITNLNPQISNLQTERQRMFERFQTTDDHCMAIVGIARDDEGQRYFVCKDSWGTGNPYGGMMYMSFDYFIMKTIAVVVARECLQATVQPPQPMKGDSEND